MLALFWAEFVLSDNLVKHKSGKGEAHKKIMKRILKLTCALTLGINK